MVISGNGEVTDVSFWSAVVGESRQGCKEERDGLAMYRN